MGGKGNAGHLIRLKYPIKDDAQFEGMRDHMLGPAKDVAELANRFNIPFAITSGHRPGEKSAHGDGFALDWSMPDFFAAPLLREMNERWGPKGYHFSWHPNRLGFDKDGKALFDENNFHFHGQLKQERYKRILDEEAVLAGTDQLELAQATAPTEQGRPHKGLRGRSAPRSSPKPVVATPIQPNGAEAAVVAAAAPAAVGTGLTNFKQTPALRGSVKTRHLNVISSRVPMGPALPELRVQGLIVGDFEKSRAHEAPAIETNRIIQGALRDVGRKTLIEGG